MFGKPSLAAIAATAALLAACSDATTDPDDTPLRYVPGQGDIADLNREERSLAKRAVRILSTDLNVPEADISLDTIRPMQWRDSSIGCPQPNQAYGQVITPGYRITLRVEKALHFVHVGKERMFVCKSAGKPMFSSIDAERQLVWGPQMIVARQDLAETLGIAEDQIIIRSALAREFDDDSLDCPEPGKTYATGKRDGFVLTLSHEGREYRYHTDLTITLPCPRITID
ncbi:MAG: hypothetical protein AAGC71_14620 [Pseudomonadota bacterium]